MESRRRSLQLHWPENKATVDTAHCIATGSDISSLASADPERLAQAEELKEQTHAEQAGSAPQQ
ncbi:hypothetical protein ACQY0O_005958 [Thecaphora frezii]